ncbi:N-glycosyltransferase [Symmachiella macrocystis]|uniref:N-glycosyltransferase n=1 Tax=Symmachiella macrocystis TaxID=2527985 RepID=A0A5C6B9F2_9PLAN|nr:glycosyltransferase [Symmachiella macrocystis]TWU07154.1 N-glycosyltransferase [Symmachiella macrocystis]
MAFSNSLQRPPLVHRARRTARRWVGRVREKLSERRFVYPRWLEAHVAQRQARLKGHAAPGQFSFLTGVYEKTPPQLFQETAAALFAQTSCEFEWVVLSHGAIPETLQRVIADVAADPRVRLIELAENRGIIGGMRVCLEAATGDYVIPLDADDLLFPDAVQVFAQAIADHDAPAFLYSDEDHVADGRPFAPFQRPAWDPVLNQAGSYIWHLCAFDRLVALDLGVYSDPGSNYCHDWDSVFRFARGGHSPQHVAEILYHWRTHAVSHTNRRQPHPGSVQSQRHVLETHIATQPHPERYEVRPFPLERGGKEWAICRKPIDPPVVDWIHHTAAHATPREEIGFPFNAQQVVTNETFVILDAARNSPAEFVVMTADNLLPSEESIWEAIGLFELHTDVALLSGRIVNHAGIVIGSGEIRGADDAYACPERGRDALAPGPFSLWLKPRSVAAVEPRFCLIRTAFLNDLAGAEPPNDIALFGRWLGEAAQASGLRVATSPLISASPST